MKISTEYISIAEDLEENDRPIGVSTVLPSKEMPTGFVIVGIGVKTTPGVMNMEEVIELKAIDFVQGDTINLTRIALTPTEAVTLRDLLEELIKNSIVE